MAPYHGRRVLSFPFTYTAWPPYAQMLQGRRAPGHASDWGMTSCTPPSRTVPCSRTRTTPSNVGLSTPNFVGGVEDNARIHS